MNTNVLMLGPECYLHGYFPSERYFADVADRIRSELALKSAPDNLARVMLHRIGSENAVALHVRRGDYVTAGPEFFPVLPQSYYLAAISYIAERVSHPVFHVFSDCPDWVRDNLHFDYPAVIHDQNQDASLCHEDLRLMSACRHIITANSTFSWWGAWLNPRPDKIVVTPRTWYGERIPPIPDLVPSAWHRIEN